MALYPVLSGALFRAADPERAHRWAIRGLRSGLLPAPREVTDPRLVVQALGLTFPHPIGLAAGFDKDAEVPDQLLRMGFGFVEIGTVTPQPQQGNPRPRMFRLTEDAAVINRLGFNNAGHEAVRARLQARASQPGIVGVNIGANKDAADRIADYVAGIEAFAGYASYFTVNVSSPNTPGLRDLQASEALDELLTRVLAARDGLAGDGRRRVPVLLKLAPDLTDVELEDAAAVVSKHRIDGLVISNTTLARAGLQAAAADQAGGLSGQPLFTRSTIILARLRQLVGPSLPIIGVGGVSSGDDAYEKLAAGATLVQLYTSMVYRGPWIASHVAAELGRRLDADGVPSLAHVIGTRTEHWAAQAL